MRAHSRSSVVACLAVAGTLAVASVEPPSPSWPPPTVVREVHLGAAPSLGAIPLAFIRNQFQYCSLICPHAVEGAITVPTAAALAPATLVARTTTGSPLRAIGATAASVTGLANAATTPLINNDVFLVVPKAFHALNVAVVELFNVGAAVLTPGAFVDAVQSGRTNILGALDHAVGPPTTPTGATNILQVVSVEVVNVTTAVAFQAGELALLGAVQTADATAQELARSGDSGAALAAGAGQAAETVAIAGGIVRDALATAEANVRDSLADPCPWATKTSQPRADDAPAASAVSTATQQTKKSDKDDTEEDAQSDEPRKAEADSEEQPKDESQTDRSDKPDDNKKPGARESD